MSVIENTIAKGLDIWGIVVRHININPDWAIEEAELNLELTGNSYVEVYYYDLYECIEDNRCTIPEHIKIDLSVEDANNMYSDISQLVEMPKGVQSLHAHLTDEAVVYFDITFVPLLK